MAGRLQASRMPVISAEPSEMVHLRPIQRSMSHSAARQPTMLSSSVQRAGRPNTQMPTAAVGSSAITTFHMHRCTLQREWSCGDVLIVSFCSI